MSKSSGLVLFHQPVSGSGGQYERNVMYTALAVLDDNSISDKVAITLFEELCGNLPISLPDTVSGVSFDTEVTPDSGRADEEMLVFLGISLYGEDPVPAEISEKSRDIADGQVTFSSQDGYNVTIILEAKNDAAHLRPEQLLRYAREFDAGIPGKNLPNLTQAIGVSSWNDVYHTLMRLKSNSTDPVESMLLDRFCTFLLYDEVQKRVGITTVDDGYEYPRHRYYVELREESGELEIRLVDEYREPTKDIDIENLQPGDVTKLADIYQPYQTPWFTESEFGDLLGQIPYEIRKKAFVGTGDKPSVKPLIEAYQAGKLEADEPAQNIGGRASKVIAQTDHRGGVRPQLRIDDNDRELKFSKFNGWGEDGTAAFGAPLTITEGELRDMLSALPQHIREAMFLDFDFDILAAEYTTQ